MQHDRAIEALDKTTVRRLHSGQVIVDIDSIVKELIENALDANARSIDVKLVDNGLKLVQVKDDGHGIDSESRPLMGQRYHTSKITSMDDLKHLTTLGFRGEALNSICALSETFQITTKTENDTLAMQYELDRSGNQTSHQPIGLISHTGTLVSAYKPFFNVPVRQQMIQRSFSFKRIQDLLTRYSLIYPEIRFALTSSVDGVGALSRISGANKWVKPATTGIMKSIATVYGSQLVDMLEHHRLTAAADQLSMECVLAKPNADPATVYRGERVHVYINKRPVNHAKCDLKEIVALARKRYNSESSKKTPFMFVSIQLNGDQLDVNLEPSKMAVMLHHKQTVIELFENLVERIYRSPTHRLFGTVQQRADDHISNYERLQEPELSPSSLQEAPSIASAGDNSSLPAQMELQEAASAHVGATDNVLADTNQTSGRGTEMRENSQTKNVEKPITHGTNDTLHDISNPTPIGSKEIPSQASDAWIDSLKRMDVDMPSLDIQLQRQLIQLPAINEQEKQHPDNINDEEVDEDEQESAAGDTGVWKFSMCSQGMSSSSSSSNDDTDERDQLLLSEDENDLQVCVEETGPRVRSLTEWLKQPCKQQQRQDQQQPAQVPTTAPPSAISRPTGAIKPSISSAVPEAVLVVNNTATTTARISPQITLPAVTELSERPTLNTESTASSSTRPMRDPQRFSPLATARSLPQQREEQISCAPVSSSSVAATPRPPTATPTRLISRARRSNRQLFVETSPDFEPQLSTNEESQWQVDPVSLNGRREPSSMILDIRQQPQRQASAPLTENQAKNSHPTSNNRSLYDMFRMQQSNRLSLPPVAPSLPVRTATEKGKSDLTRHHPSITEHPTLPPHPAIAQHQSHPTLSSVLSSPSDSSVATASIPRKLYLQTI
ncbi:hypothetical protein BDB00DRAFT_177043 [Zychaea mexicana]|uniref:uncharacterized protein n=1 Tax=Zychaea mexicana TaxID=64656 RepID=UPI0022FE2790|nr:uncharacterized protein BDB00DRAFT_177043 [Zychaea mexicana]KAI9495913.1 hypothetical protein BDB00DRAFT_177043 [Zychaea mexicana]